MSHLVVPNTLYVDIHHDPTPPGSSRPAGFWANQAWLSIPSEERKVLQHPKVASCLQHVVPLRMGAHDVPVVGCTECVYARAKIKGKCSRCYMRLYMRTYYARHKKHATSQTA